MGCCSIIAISVVAVVFSTVIFLTQWQPAILSSHPINNYLSNHHHTDGVLLKSALPNAQSNSSMKAAVEYSQPLVNDPPTAPSGILYYVPITINSLPDITISSSETLANNLYCNNLVIDTGVTLTTNGFSIVCLGSVTNDGTIDTGSPGNGGAGNTGTGAGSTGGSAFKSYAGSGGGGATGSAQGRYSSGNGGYGGNTLAPGGIGATSVASSPGVNGGDGSTPGSPVLSNANIISMFYSNFSNYTTGGGGGGGSGGKIGGTQISGGNGGSGSFGLYIQANTITAGTINAFGLAGSTGTSGEPSAGAGGGGGGTIILAYNGLGAAPSISGANVIGGSGGAGGVSGSDTGGNGGSGGAGNVLTFGYNAMPIFPIPSPFQQRISVNSLAYESYEASNLDNVEFFYSNGTIINSWLESNNIYSSTNSIYYLKLNGLGQSVASNQMTIYMGFAGTGTNLFGNTITGESPLLSPNYGEYDTGANVFPFYDNFEGSVLNTSKWVAEIHSPSTTLGTYTVDNGISTTTTTGSSIEIMSNKYFGFPNYFEWYAAPFSANAPENQYFELIVNSTNHREAIYTGNLTYMRLAYTSDEQGSTSGAFPVTSQYSVPDNSGNHIYGISVDGENVKAYFDHSIIINQSENFVPENNLNFGVFLNFEAGLTSPVEYWVRVRSYPLGGMPTTTFGSIVQVQTGALSVTLGSQCPSNTIIDIGQYQSCSATVSGGTGPYTYTFYSVNSVTTSVIANTVTIPSTSSTSEVASWFIGNPDAYNSPEEVNVIVSDSAGHTANTVYSSTFIVNPQLSVAAITPASPSIDSGQSIELTDTWTGGTPDYTAKWYTGPSGSSCAGDSANVLATYSSLTGTTNSLFVSPTTSNSYCVGITDSASSPVTQFSTVDVVTVNQVLTVPQISASISPAVSPGSTETFTATWTGGTPDYTANYLVVNTVTYEIVANALYTGISTPSNSFSWVVPSSDIGNTIMANVIITDSAYSPETKNSIETPTITISSAYTPPTVTISNPSNAIVDVGQYESFTATASGGTAPYTYNFLIVNSISPSIVTQNALYQSLPTASNVFTYQVEGFEVSNSPEEANVILTDGHPTTVNSIYSPTFAVNPELNTPTLTSSPLLPNTLDVGEEITFDTSDISGGTPDYAANYVISNSITNAIILAQEFSGLPGSTNSLAWTIPSYILGNTIEANVIITDSASANSISNSIYYKTLTINPQLTPASFTASNNPATFNQYETLNVVVDGGTPAYTYNFLVFNSIGNLVSNALVNANLNSNSFTFQINPSWGGGIFSANVYVTDNAGIPETVSNTLTFTVPISLTSTGWTASNDIVDEYQYQTSHASVIGGTEPYAYNFLIYNALGDVVDNVLYSSSDTSNSFTFQINPNWSTGDFTANVVVKDSSSPQEIAINTLTFSVSPQLLLKSFLAFNSNQTIGTTQALTATISGGTSPYTYNFLLYNPNGALVNSYITSASATTMSFIYNQQAYWGTGVFTAEVKVSDSANTPATFTNTIVYDVPTPSSAPSTSPSQSGGFGSAGGAAKGCGAEPIVIRTPSGFSVLCVVQDNSFNISLYGVKLDFTLNYITPTYAGLTVNNRSYSLYPNNNVTIQQPNTHFIFDMNMFNLSYVPILHSISINILSSPNVTPINVTTMNYTAEITTYNSIPQVINMLREKTRFTITSSSTSNQTISVKNLTSTLFLPPLPQGYAKQDIENISLYNARPETNTTLNIITKYNCSVPYYKIVPFLFANTSWNQVSEFTVNAKSCEVTFTLNTDAVFAIAQYVGIVAPNITATTTISAANHVIVMPTQRSFLMHYIQYIILLILVIIVTLMIKLIVKKRIGNRKPKKRGLRTARRKPGHMGRRTKKIKAKRKHK